MIVSSRFNFLKQTRKLSTISVRRQPLERQLPSERLHLSLTRSAKLNGLNAFTCIREEQVLNDAVEADKRLQYGKTLGPLDGKLFAVKDNFCVEGSVTSCGSNMLKNFVPTYNSTVVKKTKDAGGLIFGKTNMDEYGMGSGSIDSVFGPVKSLWRSGIPYTLPHLPSLNKGDFQVNTSGLEDGNWLISGGSSGGSAVSVSTRICDAALGSDTGGSIRIPAAWCGLVSLKPTYGTVSRHGLIPLVNSLDVPGIVSLNVDTAATYFNVLSGQDEKDSTTLDQSKIKGVSLVEDPDLSQITVGIPAEYYCEDMATEVIEAWSQVADLFEDNHIRVVPVSLPHTAYSITCYTVLNPCEVASNMARYDGLQFGLRTSEASSTEALFADVRHHGFNHVVRGRILAGNYFLLKEHYQDYFLQALKVRRLIAEDFVKVWNEVDVLLTPATLTAAPSFKDFSKSDSRTQTAKHDFCTQPVNLAGLPAATVPVKLSKNSTPISLQIIGRTCDEQTVLSVCKWLENRLQFPQPKIVE